MRNTRKRPPRAFYVNEMPVEENGERYWIMAHKNALIAKIKDRKNEALILKMRIPGFTREDAKTNYYLSADRLQ